MIVGLSLHDSTDLGRSILDAGAAIDLEKDAASGGLIDSIRDRLARVDADRSSSASA